MQCARDNSFFGFRPAGPGPHLFCGDHRLGITRLQGDVNFPSKTLELQTVRLRGDVRATGRLLAPAQGQGPGPLPGLPFQGYNPVQTSGPSLAPGSVSPSAFFSSCARDPFRAASQCTAGPPPQVGVDIQLDLRIDYQEVGSVLLLGVNAQLRSCVPVGGDE